MKVRRNLLLIGSLAAVALLLLLFSALERPETGNIVIVTVDGAEYARLPLDGPQRLTISLENGEQNVLLIEPDGIVMESATCRDQLCMKQGKVTLENSPSRALGNQIICLPHRVVCTLAGATPEDAVLPDI